MKIRVFGSIVFVGSLLVGTAVHTALAQAPTIVEFLWDDSIVPPTGNAPNDPGDIMVITGKPLGLMDATGCFPSGSYPVHNVVVIDPGYTRATRFANVIFHVFSANPLKPGTRLGDIHALTECFSNGSDYTRYEGTVE